MSAGSLRISMIAPPFFEIPPSGYGGIEAVVAMLVNGLADRGHDVTLIAAGQQGTKGTFLTTFDEPQPERLGTPMVELIHVARAEELLRDLHPDVIHDHCAAGPLAARGRSVPVVMTSHGPATGEWGDYVHAVDTMVSVVAISEAQRRLSPHIRWAGVVHNALDAADVPLRADKDDFLMWLGRTSPDKGAHLAIDMARAAGRRIVLVAKCTEPAERAHFEEHIRPRLGADVEWYDQVSPREKYDLLGAAAALLFPIQWEEPFGMVMVEAMACGTPVLATNRGAVPEVVVDGVTGFIRETTDELVEVIDRVGEISPQACRAHVDDRFGVPRMVEGYEAMYAAAIHGSEH